MKTKSSFLYAGFYDFSGSVSGGQFLNDRRNYVKSGVRNKKRFTGFDVSLGHVVTIVVFGSVPF